MKPGIHPNWYPDALVTCACGNSWTTGSTKKEIHTDVCNKCHPFFTGEQRIVDTAGQVERFMKRLSAKEQIAATQSAPEDKKAKQEKRRDRKSGTTVSLKPAVQAPSELPLAVMAEKPTVAETPMVLPVVEELMSQIQEIKFAEPVAPVEMPAPVAELAPMVEEPAPAVAVEEPVSVAMIEESAPVAQVEAAPPAVVVEEVTPVAVAQVPAPEAVVAESTPVAVVEESVSANAKSSAVEKGTRKPAARKTAAKVPTQKAAPAKPKANPVKKEKK